MASKQKILVVDDEARMRKLVGDFLKNAGFDFVEAKDGEEALKMFFADKGIELVLLDVMMPKLDGNKEEGTTGEITGNFVDGKMMIFYGGSYARLPELQRPGYIFDGWYTKDHMYNIGDMENGVLIELFK